MYSEVVQSINIMIGLLLAGVSATIVWIFKYDDWYPNPVNAIHVPESDDSGHEDMGSRTE
jgi:hypothetical protein